MAKMKHLMTAATVALIGTWALSVPAQSAEDPHHPAGEAAAQASPQTTPATPPGMAGQPGMMGGQQGMMGNMPMMSMMRMMGGGDAPGMGMIDHVEGRIAFLHTELKITDAQTAVWNPFANALRINARNLGAAHGAMMGQMSAGRPQVQTLAQRLDAQESWLTARLEGTRTLKVAFSGLYAALSDEQKTTADQLVAPHMGLMTMGHMGAMGQNPQ